MSHESGWIGKLGAWQNSPAAQVRRSLFLLMLRSRPPPPTIKEKSTIPAALSLLALSPCYRLGTRGSLLACGNVDEVTAIRGRPVLGEVVNYGNISRALDLDVSFQVHVCICTVIVRLDVVAFLIFPCEAG